jgi:hypothetical protein
MTQWGTAGKARQDERDCPCGWGGYYVSEMKHAMKHLQWERGMKLPPAMVPEGNIIVVPWNSPKKERKFAYEMARLAQRDGGYDVPSYTLPIGRGVLPSVKERGETAVLWCAQGRCLGYTVVHRVQRWREVWPFETHPEEEPIAIEGHNDIRGQIGLIWVAHGRRREGIASALIAEVGRLSGSPVSELVYTAPFTEAGFQLAKSFALDNLIYIG